MNKKLNTIKVLKEKLMNIQNYLDKIPRQQAYESQKIVRPTNDNLKRNNTSKNPYFKNPTFWGSNPILSQENSVVSLKQSPSITPKRSRIRNQHSLSPKMKQMSSKFSLSYYSLVKKQKQPLKDLNSFEEKQKYEKQKQKRIYFSNKSNGSPNNKEQTPRFHKIRTYNKQISDPILNPQTEKPQGKKIVRKIQRSPQNPYTQNPSSQPLLYFNHTQPIYLSPNKKTYNIKNQSLNIKNTLRPVNSMKKISPNTKNNIPKGRKHFIKYFQDTHCCKWA